MNRRTFIKWIFSGLAVLGVGGELSAKDRKRKEKGLDAATLKKQLYVRTKEEAKFIDKVIRLRNEKKLSEKSVNAAYKNALKQRSKRFAYFSATLKKLAKQEGVHL